MPARTLQTGGAVQKHKQKHQISRPTERRTCPSAPEGRLFFCDSPTIHFTNTLTIFNLSGSRHLKHCDSILYNIFQTADILKQPHCPTIASKRNTKKSVSKS